ncbi:MAG: methyltransferase domain-containing protein [Acidimicrobiales bacterium]
MSSSTETFQISAEQAEIYETTFVPAVFAQWAPLLLDAAGVEPGQTVLDVACGTGILARTAADRVGATGNVIGVDLNEGMLTVARRVRPDLEWRQGDAADLPFPDDTFDAVLCQSSMMFFPDATGALREMARVCKPAGTVGVQVYSSLQAQPAYGPWIDMVAQHAGPDAVSLLGTYWVHGDLDVLRTRFETAGLEITAIDTTLGTARFGSIEEMVRTEVESTPLVDRISDDVYRRIRDESSRVLGQFQTESGAEVPIEGLLVIARRP